MTSLTQAGKLLEASEAVQLMVPGEDSGFGVARSSLRRGHEFPRELPRRAVPWFERLRVALYVR